MEALANPVVLPLNNFPAPAPAVASIDAYVNWIKTIPLLTAEEEYRLAVQFHDSGDLVAAKRLVLTHLRFVVHVARNYLGYGLAEADLIQEGTIGLMKAVKRFNPRVGVRLITFAVHWIKAEIHEFILKNWRMVKIATTKAQRKLFFNLRRAAKKLQWFSQDEINVVASELKVSPKDVRQMEARMYNSDLSFERNTTDSTDEGSEAPEDYLADASLSPEEQVIESTSLVRAGDSLEEALKTLDARGRDIVTSRWLREKKATLQELATKYQVSAERIRQLEGQAMAKLRNQLQAAIYT